MSYRYQYNHEWLKPKPETTRPTTAAATRPAPGPSHPVYIALTDRLTRDGYRDLAHYLAGLYLTLARDLAGHTIPDLPYDNPPRQWHPPLAPTSIALPKYRHRLNHPLTLHIAAQLGHSTNPRWDAMRAIEALTATAGLIVDDWLEEEHPQP